MEVDWRDLRFFKFEIESICLEIRERERERERERKNYLKEIEYIIDDLM